MKKIFQNIFILLPIINILADISVYFNRGGIHFGDIRAVFEFIFIIIVLFRSNISNYKSTKIILFFSFYALIKLLLSSDPLYGLTHSYFKVTISHLLYPLAIYFIRDFSSYKKFIISSLVSGVIISINYIVSQYFRIGESVYVEDSFYLGALGAGTVSMLVLPVLTNIQLRRLIKYRHNKIITRIIVAILILFIFLVMKRIAIVVLLIGFLTQIIVLRNRNKNFRNIIFIAFAMGTLYTMFGTLFIDRFEARNQEQNEIQNESRYHETIIVFDELKEGSFVDIVFGKEMYNSFNYFNDHYGMDRQLHIDYNILLHGGGITAAAIYLIFLIFVLISFNKMIRQSKKQNRKDESYYNLVAIFYSIYFANIFLSFSGGIAYLSLKSFYMMHLGAVYGLVYWKYYKPLIYPKFYNNFHIL